MTRALAIGATIAVAGLAAPATALADLTIAVTPAEARFGQAHRATGRMTDPAGAPLAGRRLSIQAREFPFKGAFETIAHATTRADGTYTVRGIDLDRNADLRVVAFDGTTSGIARAFTYPAFELRFEVVDNNRIRLVQTYRTPKRVRLRKPTLFYVGPRSANSAPVRARGKTKRTKPGRFEARAVVRLPRSWKGRFRFASCFGYTPGSGMGDPARGCPKRFEF